MLKRPPFNLSALKSVAAGSTGRWVIAALVCVLLALGAFGFAKYQRHKAHLADEEEEERWVAAHQRGLTRQEKPDAPPPPPGGQGKPREGYATWYDVPEESLAARRAVSNEYTAAHNRLPLGTLVRVTHLKNGKSVIVRITDRGITDRKVRLDVCKEAAEELGMVTKGVARVRMEIVPDEHGVSPDEVQTAARRL
jgi:rare lipoprotein A